MSDEKKITVEYLDTDDETQLYAHYNGQHDAQRVYVYLDPEERKLSIRYDPEIDGGVPAAIWHSRVLRFSTNGWIPTASAANQLLEALADDSYVEYICDQHAIEWNGNNHVGRLTEDGLESQRRVEDFIATYFDHSDCVGEWEADEYLDGIDPTEEYGITSETTDEEISAIADKIDEEAIDEGNAGYTMLVGTEAFLTRLRDELADEDEDED